MLSLLHIENIAVIEQADIAFGKGFHALTGETGAGKSIVVDAIGTVMGGRTSRDLIRTGATSARVEAVFCQLPHLPWFDQYEVYPDPEGNLIVSRQLTAEGKNLCRVNGQVVTVTQLRELGCHLLNIHGQHDGQQLLDEACHLDYLDRFGQLEQQVADYAVAYQRVRDISKEMDALKMDEGEKSRKIDTLTYQIGEIQRGNLKAGEEETLNQRRTLLRNGGKLTDAVNQAHQALWGDHQGEGAISLLHTVEQTLARVADTSADMEGLASGFMELRTRSEDLAEQVRDLRDAFDFEPGELDQVESRLDVIYRLRKKYGPTVEDALAYLEACTKELDQIQFAGDHLVHLEKRLAQAVTQAKSLGQVLSDRRKAVGQALSARIVEELRQLDMPKVSFVTEFTPKTNPYGLDESGMDNVQFLMTANLGETPKPIQKIASGGELARIMLALKSVLAENELVTTMVFDEVDTGVSGRAAQKVAEKMAQVAQHKQVLCVTHLPQIAAMADIHFSVEKGEREGRTYTAVESLDADGRAQELARLSVGVHITQAALESARELLNSGIAFKNKK